MSRLSTFTVLFSLALTPIVSRAADDAATDAMRQKAEQIEKQKRQREEAEHDKRDALEKFAATLQQACDSFAKLQTATEAFYPRLTAMLTDDNGKRLGLQDEHCRIYLRMRDEPVVALLDVKARRKGWDELLTGVREELAKPQITWLPDPAKDKQIKDDAAWATDKSLLVERQVAWIDSTLSQAKAEDISKAPTLQEAITAYQARETELWGVATEEGRAKALQEMKPQIVGASHDEEVMKLQAQLAALKEQIETERAGSRDQAAKEIEKIVAENARALAAKDAEIQRIKALQSADQTNAAIAKSKILDDSKKAELVAKCQNSEVQDLLKPFTTPGRWQPGNSRPGFSSSPMSWKAILKTGALEKSDDGLEKFAYLCMEQLGSHPNNVTVRSFKSPDKERPKIGIPNDTNKWTTEDIAKLRSLQDLLIELGPTLVEQKMLSE